MLRKFQNLSKHHSYYSNPEFNNNKKVHLLNLSRFFINQQPVDIFIFAFLKRFICNDEKKRKLWLSSIPTRAVTHSGGIILFQ